MTVTVAGFGSATLIGQNEVFVNRGVDRVAFFDDTANTGLLVIQAAAFANPQL